jgi:hypothetical protein
MIRLCQGGRIVHQGNYGKAESIVIYGFNPNARE